VDRNTARSPRRPHAITKSITLRTTTQTRHKAWRDLLPCRFDFSVNTRDGDHGNEDTTAISRLGSRDAIGHAAGRTALIGVWQLLSYQTEFQDGSPKRAMFGEHPTGYIIFTREGRFDGRHRRIASIDTAWNPAWDGTDQVRSFRIVGNQLTVTSTWQSALNFPGAPLSRGTLLFESVK
jgi:hypothetical protein